MGIPWGTPEIHWFCLKQHILSILNILQSTQYLGVVIVQHLTWQSHIEYILKRVHTKLFVLYCLKPLLNSLLATLYCGYILPIFDYCNTVWSPPTAVLSRSMEKIYSDFVGSLSCVVVRLTLDERRRFHTAVQVFKSVCRFCLVYLNDFFVNSVALTGHCGRSPYRVFIPRIQTCLVKLVFIIVKQSFGIS